MAVFSSDLDKVNYDGPLLKLRAGFSVSLSAPHGAFHQSDGMEDKSEALLYGYNFWLTKTAQQSVL